MNENKVLVSVLYDRNNKCERVSKVTYVSEKEYNALLNEEEKSLNKKDKEKECDTKWNNEMHFRVCKLENTRLLLAKTLYDNFVDRGLLNDNDQFQQDFYHFIFNDKELDIEKTPNDFQVILRKVVNL